MNADDEQVKSSDKMRLNPKPLKVVKLATCRKCGRSWGLRGTCVCLDPDLVWPDEDADQVDGPGMRP